MAIEYVQLDLENDKFISSARLRAYRECLPVSNDYSNAAGKEDAAAARIGQMEKDPMGMQVRAEATLYE